MSELLVVLLLVLLNALLSGTEMAVVSVRRARLQTAADNGSQLARVVLGLRNDPERFLATVQVGITLVGSITSVFGGASLAAAIEPTIARVPGCAEIADELSVALVVALITYLSVVLGELIPKSLALRYAEPIAMTMARPIQVLEVLARPIVWLFVTSSNLALKPFHDSTNFVESKLSREDLATMVNEATSQSDLPETARNVLERAVEFSSARVSDVMVPRRWVVSLRKDADEAAIRHALLEQGHRRVPVHDGELDSAASYVLREDVMALLWDGKPVTLESVARPAHILPESMPADRALLDMQQRRVHIALVVDENGSVSGIVTMEDLLEELVGEIFSEHESAKIEAQIEAAADGSWLAQGNVSIRDFERATGAELDAPETAKTLSGMMVLGGSGGIPTQGTTLETSTGWVLEAIEVSVRRVRKLRVRRKAAPPDSDDQPAAD